MLPRRQSKHYKLVQIKKLRAKLGHTVHPANKRKQCDRQRRFVALHPRYLLYQCLKLQN